MPSPSIHINPKFRNVHINPSFLGKPSNGNGDSIKPTATISRPQIYINPRFLNAQSTAVAIHSVDKNLQELPLAIEPLADTKIHTRKKIMNVSKPRMAGVLQPTTNLKPLIRIGSKKLIRVSDQTLSEPTKPITKVRRPIQTKYKIVKEQTAFKIDRRTEKSKQVASVLRKVAALHSNKRQWIKENLMPTKTVISDAFSRSKVTSSSPQSSQKPSTYLNINGILYKANRRKLEKTTNKYSINKTKINSNIDPSYRRLTVRGESFLLDASGKNLIKVQNEKPATGTIKRIDIGKITFMKKSNGTFERTDFHKSRFHLNVAKQRSIQMLTNRLVKTNVPCPIYRKLGKCATFERGKCTKLHDQKLVDICPSFLRGTCHKETCLLSHNTTLSKMPTCKFYLLGMCSRSDCPYLHKKVNEKTEICIEFLRGYCELAEECSKRHEFLCPEQESKGSCKLTRCPYPHRKVSSKPKPKPEPKSKAVKVVKTIADREPEPEKSNATRYFTDEANQSEDLTVQCVNKNSANENSASASAEPVGEKISFSKRPKLGTLPSFIPIG